MYPQAVMSDVVNFVAAFYDHRLAISDGRDGIRELIVFNRHFSKVDATRYQEDPHGQTQRYSDVKRVLMLQLSLMFEEAVNDYEQTRLACTQLIAAHDDQMRQLDAKLKAAPLDEKESICQEIALASLNFIERARDLHKKMQVCKERIHA
jgi:hypothetical protein